MNGPTAARSVVRNETVVSGLEETGPHALEMAQEADAPPHAGPEDA
jgi:hypothetical protein